MFNLSDNLDRALAGIHKKEQLLRFVLNATDILVSFSKLNAYYVMLLNKGNDLGKWMHELLHLLNNSLAPKK